MDKVFSKPIKKQFEFDESVATVFDDMLERSIPFYKDVIALVCDLVELHCKDDAKVIDLGCSTANTLLNLYKKSHDYNLIGIDNSEAMLENASKKINAYGANIELINGDITKVDLNGSDVIIANYMLQFIRPLVRDTFVKKIYDSLEVDGVFIFSEKIIFEDKTLNKQMIDMYYEFKKKQGYSEFEISQKREALENVLVPYTEEENKKMILNAGFKSVESLFKYGNFVTFLAKK
ncbi:carboxy-S-adenosyl-L-methionine synthase CmoA [Sulfurospirillum arcachonense]|uniref:carboxy-S-adenosyl-L-methionine synthase CmoA n=1 Tax=Sulfurospirillum arcachonense TaxID=57666 RepID=UPI000469EA20|nr:carboxy-S-adenosyl-L-methionine synthase CmoA [Sulfurospirillum arcachonense]